VFLKKKNYDSLYAGNDRLSMIRVINLIIICFILLLFAKCAEIVYGAAYAVGEAVGPNHGARGGLEIKKQFIILNTGMKNLFSGWVIRDGNYFIG
jgi:hypothetical protein